MRSRPLALRAASMILDAARPSFPRAPLPAIVLLLLALMLAVQPAVGQRQPGDAALWATRIATVAARRDGWIELREVPDRYSRQRPDADTHQMDEWSVAPEHLRVTPAAAERWRGEVARMLEESTAGGAGFWSRGQDGRVLTPELASPGQPVGVMLIWSHRDGRVVIDGGRQACLAGHSLQDLTHADVRAFLDALARAAATARRFRAAPAPVDTARPYGYTAVACQAVADSTPGLPRLPPDPRRPAEVLVSLVVDRRGAVETRTLRLAPAVDAGTEQAIRGMLARWHFTPAQLAGVTVRQRAHFVLAFTPQPPADDPEARHPTRMGAVPGWAVGRDHGWVVIRPRPDTRSDTLFSGTRHERMSLAPREVARWLSDLNPFWRRAAAWRPPARYNETISGPGIGPAYNRLHARARWVANRTVTGLVLGIDGESLDWEQARLLTSRMAREATAALAGPAPVLDTIRAHPEVAVDRAAAFSDSNVARVAVPGADGDHDEVLLRFVVDRRGLVEPASITAVYAPSAAAARAATRLAVGWEYTPAMLAGRPVRQWAHATVRVVGPGQAPAPAPRPSRAARLAARDGCEMTRGPVSADYDTGEWERYHHALFPSVEFRCEIAPSLPPYRVVLTADTSGWRTGMHVYAGDHARPPQSLDGETTESPTVGITILQARDLDGDGYRDLMLYDWSGTGGIGHKVWRFRPARGVFVADSVASAMNGISPVPGEPCVTEGTGRGLEKVCAVGGRWRTAWVERWTKTVTPGRCLVTRTARQGGREVVLLRRYEQWGC